MTTREQIVNEALKWVGTPYHHQGKILGGGVDCGQLLVAVYCDTGIVPAVDVDAYPPDWHLHRSEEKYLGYVIEHAHEVDTPLPGDIALFKWGRVISHGAIVKEYPFIIHAYRPDRKCTVSNIDTNEELKARFVSFYRLNILGE